MSQESHPADATGVPLARPIAAPVGPCDVLPSPLSVPRDGWSSTRQATLDALLVLALGILVPFAPGLILFNLANVSATGAIDRIDLAVVLQKAAEATVALALLAYLVLRGGYPAESFGLRSSRPFGQLGAAVVTFAALYGALILVSVGAVAVFWLLGSDFSQDMRQRVEFAQAMPFGSRTTLFGLLAGVALHEEIVFRGLLLPLLCAVSGSWLRSTLLTSVLFGVLHVPGQGPLAGAQAFGLSLVFAAMFIRSRSLPAVVLAHFSFDALQLELVRTLRNANWLMSPSAQG